MMNEEQMWVRMTYGVFADNPEDAARCALAAASQGGVFIEVFTELDRLLAEFDEGHFGSELGQAASDAQQAFDFEG
jgi:hypothetical protein